jgi:hypothetical protein
MRIIIVMRAAPTLLACALMLGVPGAARAQAGAPDDALGTFSDSVQRYADLRTRLEQPFPQMRPSRGAWSTLVARRYLASAIRSTRTADQGDVFTPGVERLFRDRLDAALTPSERLLLAGPDDGEGGAPIPVVNEPLADVWMTAPPVALAQHLPPLPEGIEYRFVRSDLVLWDAHAEIVIDVLPDVLR